MKDVLANANGIYLRGDHAGEKILECNLEKMKNWTEEEIDNAIDENDKLRVNKSDERILLSNSRTRIAKALGEIMRKKKDATDNSNQGSNRFNGNKGRQFAMILTSKENILSQFKKVEIEL